jgi:hypothetical protein
VNIDFAPLFEEKRFGKRILRFAFDDDGQNMLPPVNLDKVGISFATQSDSGVRGEQMTIRYSDWSSADRISSLKLEDTVSSS